MSVTLPTYRSPVGGPWSICGWAFARHRAPVALEWLSFAGLGLGVLAVALEGVHARDLAIGPAAEDAVDPAQIH
jgi:hypothetical protein